MSSNEYPAGEVEVRGATYPVTVDDAGRWSTHYNDALVAARTKEEFARGPADQARMGGLSARYDVQGSDCPGSPTERQGVLKTSFSVGSIPTRGTQDHF